MKMPVEIQRMKDPDGAHRFKAVISLKDMPTNLSINDKLISLQKRYATFVEECRKKLNSLTQSKKNRGDPILKWDLANHIYNFLKNLEKEGFVLANLTEALSRDLGISRRQINYLIEFRETYPKLNLIRKEISWDKYKELLDIPDRDKRRLCEKEIIEGRLRTREDIRRFKKKLKTK